MNQWGLTDRGNVRAQNQDYFTIVRFSPEHALAVVCDGMGGAKSGNVASRLATDVFIREVKRTWNASLDDDALRRMLVDAVELANQAVYEHAQLSEDFSGMGTTLVAAFVKTDLAIAVNVGDSRAYSSGSRRDPDYGGPLRCPAYGPAGGDHRGGGKDLPRQEPHHPRRRDGTPRQLRRLHPPGRPGRRHPALLRRAFQPADGPGAIV
ncbi:MAG: protein phosphatase 2C domain-containing protein [Oscillospiraceae bacterium]